MKKEILEKAKKEAKKYNINPFEKNAVLLIIISVVISSVVSTILSKIDFETAKSLTTIPVLDLLIYAIVLTMCLVGFIWGIFKFLEGLNIFCEAIKIQRKNNLSRSIVLKQKS